jgi:hypothetical protein
VGNLDLADVKAIHDEAKHVCWLVRQAQARDDNELRLHKSVQRLSELLFCVTEGILEEHGIQAVESEGTIYG